MFFLIFGNEYTRKCLRVIRKPELEEGEEAKLSLPEIFRINPLGSRLYPDSYAFSKLTNYF